MTENITNSSEALEEIRVLIERNGQIRTSEHVPIDAKIHLDAVDHHLHQADAVLALDRARTDERTDEE